MIKWVVFIMLFLHAQRFSQVVLSEIYCNVKGSDRDYSYLEFIELFNQGPDFYDMVSIGIKDLSDTNDVYRVMRNNGKNGILEKEYALILDPDYPLSENPLNVPDSIMLLTVESDKTIGNTLKAKDECVYLYIGERKVDEFCWEEDPGDGVSWERVNLDDSTGNRTWGFCVDDFGCTPGYKNSLFSVEKERTFKYDVISQNIIPSQNELLIVDIKALEECVVRLGVFGYKGSLYGWVEEGSRINSQYRFSWNGTFKNGKSLKIGFYILHIEMKPEKKGPLKRFQVPFTYEP